MNATMATENLRQRNVPTSVPMNGSKATTEKAKLSTEPTPHPGGEIKHGAWKQALRMLLFAAYFNGSIIA